MEAIQNINQKILEVTLRDMFAMSALNGLLSSGLYKPSEIPKTAYELADAMLEARNKKNDVC